MDSFFSLIPVVPSSTALRWATPMMWAVVLGWLALRSVQALAPRGGFGWAAVNRAKRGPAVAGVAVSFWVVLSSLLGWTALSPSYWLGLAFQLPSWTTVLLCVVACTGPGQRHTIDAQSHRFGDVESLCFAAAGALLGWVLLLDSFALGSSRGLYHLGFGAPAVLVLALITIAIILLGQIARKSTALDSSGRHVSHGERTAILILVALSLHVLTRLTTGNVFDALLDPWLWVWLQINLLRSFIRAAGRSAAIHG